MVNDMAWAGIGARVIAARLVTASKPLATEIFRNFSGGGKAGIFHLCVLMMNEGIMHFFERIT